MSDLPPFQRVPAPFFTIIDTFVAGGLVALLFAGVALCQFFFCFSLLLSKEDPEWESKRRVLKWRLLATALTLLFVALLADIVVKGLEVSLTIHNVVREGLNGLLFLPPIATGGPALEGFICFVVQMVYAVRLAVIWPNRGWFVWSFVTLTVVCTFAQLGSACWVSYILRTNPLTNWGPAARKGTISWWLIAAVDDILLCGAFVHHLLRMRRASGFKKTNRLLYKWILLTLETGLLSTIAQVLGLLFLFIYPNDEQPANFALTLVLAEVYLISILVLFRTMLSGGMTTSVTNTMPASSGGGGGTRWTTSEHSRSPPAANVHVLTDIRQSTDRQAHPTGYEMPKYPSVRGQVIQSVHSSKDDSSEKRSGEYSDLRDVV